MIRPVYHRQSRTLTSEQYQIMQDDERVAHLDLHYGQTEVYGTLVLDRDIEEEAVTELIERIDEDLVLSAEVARENFLVRTFVGREVGFYSDELLADEFPGDDLEED